MLINEQDDLGCLVTQTQLLKLPFPPPMAPTVTSAAPHKPVEMDPAKKWYCRMEKEVCVCLARGGNTDVYRPEVCICLWV